MSQIGKSLDKLVDSLTKLALGAMVLDLVLLLIAIGLLRAANVDFSNMEIRGQYQDVFSGVLGFTGALLASSFAAFAFVTHSSQGSLAPTHHRTGIRGLANSLLLITVEGLLLALICLYLLAKHDLSNDTDQFVMASLVALVPTFAASFFLLVRSSVSFKLRFP